MRKANAEMIVADSTNNVQGFIFSPDFDTSQEMDLSDFMHSLRQGEYKAVFKTYKYKGVDIPVVLFGNRSDLDDDRFKSIIKSNIYLIDWQINGNLDVERLTRDNARMSCSEITFDDDEVYLIQDKDQFFCFVEHDLVIFVANPFPCIFKKNEVLQDKKYKENKHVRLKGYASCIESYADEIKTRQDMFRKDVSELFKKFVEEDACTKLVIGTANLFLKRGYVLLMGSERDHKICFDKRLFPYKSVDNKLIRYSDEEINQIEKERDEYERKCKIVDERILAIEKLLKDNGLTYTVISRGKINFKEDGSWSTWMNAQIYDDAAYGWFGEQDFLDWLNCTGKIPFKRGNVRRLSKILCEVSNSEFEFDGLTPVDKKNCSMYDNYDVVANFNHNGKKVTLNIDEVKNEIERFGGYKIYTTDDIEKLLPKPKLVDKIKNIFTKSMQVCTR